MTIEANRIESVTPPWILDPASRWVTVKEFASLYRRSVRRIQEMCRDGDIAGSGGSDSSLAIAPS